jgi:hypothetical protein
MGATQAKPLPPSLAPILSLVQTGDVGLRGTGCWNPTGGTWRRQSLFFATDPRAIDHVGSTSFATKSQRAQREGSSDPSLCALCDSVVKSASVAQANTSIPLSAGRGKAAWHRAQAPRSRGTSAPQAGHASRTGQGRPKR